MGTTNVEFVFMNEQAGLDGGATVTANPYVQAMDRQNALQQTYRQPGGGSYQQTPQTITGNQALVSQLDFGCANDGYAKHGVFHVTLSGTTPATMKVTDLTSGATSYAGDTTFATVNKIKFFNLGSLDGTTGGTVTVAPASANPFTLGYGGTSPTVPVYKAGEYVWSNPAGVATSGTVNAITITPAAGGNFVAVVCGS